MPRHYPAKLRRRTCERMLAGEAVKDLSDELGIHNVTPLLLLRGAGPLLAQSGRLGHRPSLSSGTGPRCHRQGGRIEDDLALDSDPFRPWQSVHVVGVHRERPTPRAPRLDGHGRRLLRQRLDGVVLGLDADRTPESEKWRTNLELAIAMADYIEHFYNPDPPTQLAQLSHPERVRRLTLNHHPAGHVVLESGPLNGVKPIESGCRDLNPGPLDPQSSALTKLRHSPSAAASSPLFAWTSSVPLPHLIGWRGAVVGEQRL
jgi:hypothetical protein